MRFSKGEYKLYSEVITAMLQGMEVLCVRVEADLSEGLPVFDMVGYLSSEVREAKERVRMGLKNSGVRLLPKKITVNLKPAFVRKSGTGFDLPVAVALASAMGQINKKLLEEVVIVGEIGLDGAVLPILGVLPIASKMRELNYHILIIPEENRIEAQLIPDLQVIGVRTLGEVMEYLNHGRLPEQSNRLKVEKIVHSGQNDYRCEKDFSDIHGQTLLKRACEVAVSGRHNMLIVGPPGAGKTMLASRIPSIMPPMNQEEILSVTKIYSVCGLLEKEKLKTERPFRAPHHSISLKGMVGGGIQLHPGEISLAHQGVLFLDELPEFQKQTLDNLRQPMEDKQITITRASGSFSYPANFMLVGAMNPCKCGYYPDFTRCRCTESSIRSYLNKISRPLVDRVDISVLAQEVNYADMMESKKEENSACIRKRVLEIHQLQWLRYQDESYQFNSQIPPKQFEQYCVLTTESQNYLKMIFEKDRMSVRAYHKLIRVGRTIADMEHHETIKLEDLLEAYCYREAEHTFWNCL